MRITIEFQRAYRGDLDFIQEGVKDFLDIELEKIDYEKRSLVYKTNMMRVSEDMQDLSEMFFGTAYTTIVALLERLDLYHIGLYLIND